MSIVEVHVGGAKQVVMAIRIIALDMTNRVWY